MRVSKLVRMAVLVTAAGIGACGETTAPAAAPNVAPDGPSFAQSNGNGNGGRDDYLSANLTIDPTRTTLYQIGQHWVRIPANTVCQLGTPYGVKEWDKPCKVATKAMNLSVKITVVDGQPAAEFSPDMRFAPSDDASKWVVLGLKVQGSLNGALGYGILYQAKGTKTWIDESVDDPSLRAWRSQGNTIARRLKHFSGYNVALGRYREQSAPDGY